MLDIHGLDADAFFGMDDLREWCMRQGTTIPVYLNRPTYETVAGAFPYMVDKTRASGGGDVCVSVDRCSCGVLMYGD